MSKCIKFGITVFILATIVSAVFTLAMVNDWLKIIIDCEGVGCSGEGITYLLISAFIMISSIVFSLVLGPKPKYVSALYAGGLASLAMFMSFEIYNIYNQSEQEKRIKAHDKACIDYPQLCPER